MTMKFSLNKVLAFVMFLFTASFFAQTIYGQDSIPVKKNLKNTIRINLTNPMIFGDGCFMVGYERTIGKHQSISANIGRFSLPRLVDINTDSI